MAQIKIDLGLVTADAGYFSYKGGAVTFTSASTVPTGVTKVGSVTKSGNVYTYTSNTSDAVSITVGKTNSGAAEWKVTLNGGGDDYVKFASGGSKATVNAGAGNDTIDLTNVQKESSIVGGAGNDSFGGTGAVDGIIIDAGAGNDVIGDGTAIANSTILGGDGNDVIAAGGTNNTINAGAGNDSIVLDAGDTVTSGAGNDTIKMGTGTGKAVLTDYSTSDVISFATPNAVLTQLGSADNAKATFLSDGSIKDGSFTLSPSSTAASYKVKVTDNNEKVYDVWYAGSSGTTINASGETKGVFMVGNNNEDAGDYLVGGSGKDTIYAGVNDSVNGGAGNDNIVLDSGASNVYIAIGSTSGKDTISGTFKAGWSEGTSDVIYLLDGFNANTKVKQASGSVTISGGTAALEFSAGANAGGFATFLATDSTGKLKKMAVVEAGSTGTIASGDSLADYYLGDGSTLNASAYDNKLTVDLGNTGKYGSQATFVGITAVQGSNNDDNVLVGAAGTKNTLIGGTGNLSNSIYGGGASNDSLVGGSGANDTFYFGNANGNDTVSGYTAGEDTLYLFSTAVTETSNDGSNTTIKFSDGKLVLEGVSDANTNISFTTDGASTQAARIGKSNEQNQFTYDSKVTYYFGGKQGDVLQVSGSDDAKVWLNGNDALGQYYTGITNLDASSASGNVELAGSTKSDSIKGGSGSSSIWGGSGAVNDTLEGGDGSNTFYFGLGEGKDVISSSNDSDKVMLYNVSLAQVSGAAVDSSGNMVISLTDGSALTLRNFTSNGATNFSLADGSYTYDKETNTWKNA